MRNVTPPLATFEGSFTQSYIKRHGHPRNSAEIPRWCPNKSEVVFPPSRFACQRLRAETGVPGPVIRLNTWQPTFASVR
jgi:hypothetical protein